MASSTLVNTAEVAELRLVHFLGNHDATSPFVLSCEDAIEHANAPALLRTIISNQGAIDRLVSAEEGVGAFCLLAALFDRIDDTNTTLELVKALVSAVEESEVKNIQNKTGMLCTLYNLMRGTEKCWILGRILNLAAFDKCSDESNILNLLPDRKSTLGTLLDGTNLERILAGFGALSVEDERALYGIASRVVGKLSEVCRAKGMEKEAVSAESSKQRFLLKMLATYENVSDVDAEARSAAKEAAIGAISNPVSLFVEQRCIMSLPPVVALKDDDKPLYALLEIFQQGKLEDFQSFTKSNDLSVYKINEEDAIRNIRLLSLCSLATEHEEIPYDAIATTLQVDKEDVESWVIAAVSSGLVSAKMDQLQRVVMVERCAVRRFGIEQWKILQERLNVWKKNVKSVLDGLKQGQA